MRCALGLALIHASATGGLPSATGAPAAPAVPTQVASVVHLKLQTEWGDVLLDVDTAHAPLTAANFLRYVDAGRYDGGAFHRALTRGNQTGHAAAVELVQASVARRHRGHDFPAVALESTDRTGLRHLDGTLSMARDAAPDSATSQFFVTLGAQPQLDAGGRRHPDGRGFAAFGRVTAGLDVLRRIQSAPLQGERLVAPVRILRILRQH